MGWGFRQALGARSGLLLWSGQDGYRAQVLQQPYIDSYKYIWHITTVYLGNVLNTLNGNIHPLHKQHIHNLLKQLHSTNIRALKGNHIYYIIKYLFIYISLLSNLTISQFNYPSIKHFKLKRANMRK